MATNFAIIDGDLALGYTAEFTRTSGLPKLQQQVSAIVRRAVERARRNSLRGIPASSPALRLKVASVIRDALASLATAHTRLTELGVDVDSSELLGQVIRLDVAPMTVGSTVDTRELVYNVVVRAQSGATLPIGGSFRLA